jgi:iron complex transport system substrate-binding protein
MTRFGWPAFVYLLGSCAISALPWSALAETHRVASLNPCLDTTLVSLADPEQIAALSHYAREPGSSTIAEIALQFPVTYETAEEVIALDPNLVLASRHTALSTRNALRRLGIKIELFDVPTSVADSFEQIRTVAHLIDREERGEALIARIERALEAATPPPDAPRITALLFQRNGFSSGHGTLVDEMLTRTGFINIAVRYGLRDWGNIPLERVIADPPQVLLAGEVTPGMPTWADRVLRHPALMQAELHVSRATFPERLLYCGGPVLIESAAALANARRRVTESQP